MSNVERSIFDRVIEELSVLTDAQGEDLEEAKKCFLSEAGRQELFQAILSFFAAFLALIENGQLPLMLEAALEILCKANFQSVVSAYLQVLMEGVDHAIGCRNKELAKYVKEVYEQAGQPLTQEAREKIASSIAWKREEVFRMLEVSKEFPKVILNK